MEEKDVTFNIVSGISGSDDESDIGITSDIDDNIDYLSVDERMNLIIKLISQSCIQIIAENYPDNDVEEYDEDDELQEETRDNINQYLSSLIYVAINVVNNTIRAKFGKSVQQLEYSLATFIPKSTILDEHINIIDRTYHSEEITAIDPIQASFEFFTDTIYCLLNNDKSKEEVKKMIEDYMTAMKNDFINIIDNFKKE